MVEGLGIAWDDGAFASGLGFGGLFAPGEGLDEEGPVQGAGELGVPVEDTGGTVVPIETDGGSTPEGALVHEEVFKDPDEDLVGEGLGGGYGGPAATDLFPSTSSGELAFVGVLWMVWRVLGQLSDPVNESVLFQ